MTLVRLLSDVSWVAVAFVPVLLVGLVAGWVAQHRRPAGGPDDVPPGPAPGSAPDQPSSDSGSTIRSTDRR